MTYTQFTPLKQLSLKQLSLKQLLRLYIFEKGDLPSHWPETKKVEKEDYNLAV